MGSWDALFIRELYFGFYVGGNFTVLYGNGYGANLIIAGGHCASVSVLNVFVSGSRGMFLAHYITSATSFSHPGSLYFVFYRSYNLAWLFGHYSTPYRGSTFGNNFLFYGGCFKGLARVIFYFMGLQYVLSFHATLGVSRTIVFYFGRHVVQSYFIYSLRIYAVRVSTAWGGTFFIRSCFLTFLGGPIAS